MPEPGNDTQQSQPNTSRQALDAVLREVPKGALALASIAVVILVAAWLLMYLLVFVPRGMVG
jgi:hypothetical protein